ncbi:CHAT domain-containing protein [Winogradskyella ursingii]|uniref:CHAT domain-containing protein n=1 Tax=Winogradskyella ursingii TaxID=2686079 RepID=UPI0015CA928C|nr:CHAT domain-containing protein [Winogradskyella ursingii]
MKWLSQIIFILILSVCNLQAQEKNIFDYWLEEYNSGYNLMEAEDYTNAAIHFKKAFEVIDQIDFSTDAETQLYPVDNEYYLALVLFNLNLYKEASIHFTGAIEQIKQLNGDYEEFITEATANLATSLAFFDLQEAINIRIELIDKLKTYGQTQSLTYGQQLFSLAFHYRNSGLEDKFYNTLVNTALVFSNINSTENDYYAYISYHLGNYYFDINNHELASKYLTKATALIDYLKNDKSINLPDIIYLNSVALVRLGNYKDAVSQLKTIVEKPYYKQPENLQLYATLIDYYSNALLKTNQPEKAKKLYIENIEVISKTLGTNNEIYANQQNNFGLFYLESENLKDAKHHLDIAKNTFDNINSKNTLNYFQLLNNLGQLSYFTGNYEEAENYYLEAINLHSTLPDQMPINAINVENNLALVYQNTGGDDYQKAEKIYENILDRKKEILGENHPDYAMTLMNYGNLQIELGNYFKAEDIFNASLNVFENTLGPTSLAYAKQLLNLGQFYYTTRQSKKSLDVFNKAIDIYNINNANTTYGMALALAGKGLTLQFLGEVDNALEIQLQSFKILENTVGKGHIDYGKIATNIGLSYYMKNNISTALAYFEKALESYKLSLKDGHYLYGNLLTNIAEAQIYLGENEAAIDNLNVALDNFKNNYGIESYYYSTTLIQQGVALMRSGNFQKALTLLKTAEPILLKFNKKNSDIYNQLLFHLAVNYELLKDEKLATEYYNAYYSGFIVELKDIFTYRSEKEKKDFIKRYETTLSWLNNSVFNENFRNPNLISLGLNNQLLFKGLLLNSTKDVLTELSKSTDKNIQKKVENYRLLRLQRDQLLNRSPEKEDKNLSQIQNQINNLETELVKIYSKEGKGDVDNFDKDWKSIQSNLSEKEIALEFVNYKERDGKNITNKIVYSVYLIHKNWDQPKVVELFKEEDLKAILKSKNPNILYQTRGSKAKSTSTTKGLYELIWAPIEEHLVGIETIYYSPSGLLNQIPFAALDTEEQPILASQYNLIQLSNTYHLTEKMVEPTPENTIFIGGVDYDFVPTNQKIDNTKSTSNIPAFRNTSGTRSLGSNWSYLQGTLEEVKSVENLFSKSGKIYSNLIGKDATETAFKALSGNSPNIIHIATHGFFFENPKNDLDDVIISSQNNLYKVSEDPLLRSGLLFAGANYAWKNGNNPYTDDDGILTALEISNLNLSKTDVVVLSACETGLGDIDGSEGVYGLQRAFKMAGVDIIIMSLWEVPDEETSEFMQQFYSNWLSGQDIRTAFRNTQLEMSTKYKNNPEKWAAFVLFE